MAPASYLTHARAVLFRMKQTLIDGRPKDLKNGLIFA